MKLLKIGGGEDYAMLQFREVHGGTPVLTVLNNLEHFRDGDWELEVVEFKGDSKDLDPELITWLKRQVDHDTAKHEFFFFDNEEIKPF